MAIWKLENVTLVNCHNFATTPCPRQITQRKRGRQLKAHLSFWELTMVISLRRKRYATVLKMVQSCCCAWKWHFKFFSFRKWREEEKKPQSIRMMSWWHINKARYMPIAKAIVLSFRVFEEWNHILETGISSVEIFLKLGEVWEEVMKRKAKGSLIYMMT